MRRRSRATRRTTAYSYIQGDDDFYLGAWRRAEVGRNKIWLNHPCEPNIVIRGQATSIAMRAVRAGEELTYDWAMEENVRALSRCEDPPSFTFAGARASLMRPGSRP